MYSSHLLIAFSPIYFFFNTTSEVLGSAHYLWGSRGWMVLRRGCKNLKIAEGGVMLILD
jgi:hypothetical protein